MPTVKHVSHRRVSIVESITIRSGEVEGGTEDGVDIEEVDAVYRTSCNGRHNKPVCTTVDSSFDAPTQDPSASVTALEVSVSVTARATQVKPWPTYRIQMLSDFFDLYFPSLQQGVQPSGWLLKVPTTATSSSLFTFAVDALCLANLGKAKNDPELKHASHEAYGRVVRFLQKTLQLSQQRWESVDHRMLIVSILTLALLDASSPTPEQSNNNWMSHWEAAHQIVTMRGPSAFDMLDPLTEAMLVELFHGVVILAVARRKAVDSVGTRWSDASVWGRSGGVKGWNLRNLFPVMAKVPGFLERTDVLLAASQDSENDAALVAVCQDIEEVQGKLEKDTKAIISCAPLELVTSADDKAFDFEIEEHCFINTSTAIRHQYRFLSSKNNAQHACDVYVRSTVYLLALLCTTLRILHFRPHLQLNPKVPSWKSVEDQAYDTAVELCRTVYQSSQHPSIAMPPWIIIYLELAQNVFEEQEALKEIGWCQAGRIASRIRYERLSLIRPPTLCRVGDLPRGIAELGRYTALRILETPDEDLKVCPLQHHDTS